MISIIKEQLHLKVAIKEMYPRIPWELVTDPMAPSEQTLGITALN